MKIPLFPLDVVLFPGAPLPLHIYEERYKEMISDCLARNEAFGVVQWHRDGLATIGCTASIVRIMRRYPDGRMDIFCRGEHRFEIESLCEQRSFLQAEVDLLQEGEAQSIRPDREECVALHMEMMELTGADFAEFPQVDLNKPVAYLLASDVPADREFQQEILRLPSDWERTARLMEFYNLLLPKLRRGSLAGKSAGQNGHIM